MKKSKKNYVVIALVVILLALAIGYSAFSSTLKISGTAEGTGTWDVKFTAAQLLDANGNVDTDHGSVSFTASTVTVNVELAYPGDAVLLDTTITNAGSVPAKLKSVTPAGVNSDDLVITEANPTANETLSANGGTCKPQYVIQWKSTSEATTLNQSFTVTFEYEQDTTAVNITPSHGGTH